MIKKFNIFIIIFITLYLLYYFATPVILNTERNKEFIKDVIQKQSGVDIDYKNSHLKMGLIPSVMFSADEISATNGLLLKDVNIKIKLLPLIFNKIKVSRFTCEKINADFKLDENGNLFLGNYLVKPLKQSIDAELSILRIYDFDINFDDKLNKKNIRLNGKHFEIKENEDLFISMLGDIKINNKVSGIHFDLKNSNKKDIDDTTVQGHLTNFNLEEISPYVSKLSKNAIENISGNISIQTKTEQKNVFANISSEDFLIKLKDLEKPIYLKNKCIINTDLKFEKNSLLLTKFKINSKDLTAEAFGKIENLTSKFPKYNLDFKIINTKSENIFGLIPYANFPEVDINLKKLRDYGIYGLVNGQVNIEGNDDKPNLTGSFVATDVYVQRPLNIPKATIKLDFKDKKCYFDAYAPASNTQHVSVIGNVELYNQKNAEIDIKSTSFVDLKTAQIILNPLHEILDFEIGPVPIMDIHGVGNIDLKVKGNKEYPHLFGEFNFKNGTVSFDDVNAVIKNASGKLLFQNENMHFVSHHATLNNAIIKVEGDCSTQGVLNFNVKSDGQSLNEAVKILNSSPMLSSMNKITQPIKATSGKINLNINLKGKMKHIDEFEFGKTIVASGQVKLLNNNVIVGNSIFLIKNIIGNITFNNQDVDFNFSPLIGGQRLNINGKIKDKKIYFKNKLHNLNLKIMDSDILVKNAEINAEGDKIILKKINCEVDSKPILLDGNISNIFDNPKFDLYYSSTLTPQFMDKFINHKMIYPIILKGNINYSSKINGTLNDLKLNGAVNMDKGSSIYYKGAILDAVKSPLKINFDILTSRNGFNIKKLQYSEINNQNKIEQILLISGKILKSGQNMSFSNLKIKTQKPADARIFNVIFKKHVIKEGIFTSDLTINGNINNPLTIGTFNISGVNAPFLDTTIKDINLVFKQKTADLKMKGEILSNEITFNANVNNSLKTPYVVNNADLYLGNFNVNTFLKHLNRLSIEDVDKKSDNEISSDFNIHDFNIKKLNIRAKSVHVRNLFANDVNAKISLINGLFKLEKLNFVTAEGTISGKMSYNFYNSKMTLSFLLDKINANTIFDALFDVKDQFYGDLSGEVNLSCNGKSHEDCMKTLSGNCQFSVLDGKMPKLGSLEYLLKSSNVIKSGITGLTLNNLIDILTPLKTGEFESIKGKFSISEGVTKDINIASKGKDLSIFISGEYNFSSADVGLEIYGRLAKNISNVLGVVGNISINTLFNTIPGVNLSKTNKTDFVQIINKIPGIELNTNDYRIFFVKLDGNNNTEEFKKIFKWID